MPGYADYKRLYREEFKTLYDEGFDPYKYINNDKDSPDFCPAPVRKVMVLAISASVQPMVSAAWVTVSQEVAWMLIREKSPRAARYSFTRSTDIAFLL